ncbi:MAG: hypothetical protein RQ715_09700 [Methylococcales bacterium]|nr:hypothetical protein [Methylococcales bacterium]
MDIPAFKSASTHPPLPAKTAAILAQLPEQQPLPVRIQSVSQFRNQVMLSISGVNVTSPMPEHYPAQPGQSLTVVAAHGGSTLTLTVLQPDSLEPLNPPVRFSIALTGAKAAGPLTTTPGPSSPPNTQQTATPRTIGTTISRLLPHHQAPERLLNRLMNAPQTLQTQQTQTLLDSLPQLSELSQPGRLASAFRQSGIFLESRLAAVWLQQTSLSDSDALADDSPAAKTPGPAPSGSASGLTSSAAKTPGTVTPVPEQQTPMPRPMPADSRAEDSQTPARLTTRAATPAMPSNQHTEPDTLKPVPGNTRHTSDTGKPAQPPPASLRPASEQSTQAASLKTTETAAIVTANQSRDTPRPALSDTLPRAAALKPAPVSDELSAQAPAPRLPVDLAKDLKLQLLHLAQALKSTPEATPMQQQLSQHVENTLAHVTLEQLASLPNENQQVWHTSLPFLHREQIEHIDLKITREQGAPEADHPFSWWVDITLSPPGLAVLHCRISCIEQTVHTRFWSGDVGTVDTIQSHLDTLAHQLTQAELKPGILSAHHSAPKPSSKTDLNDSQPGLFNAKA